MGAPQPLPTLPRRLSLELYKREQSTVLNKLYVDSIQSGTDRTLQVGKFLAARVEAWNAL
jgi:hypothetical protein